MFIFANRTQMSVEIFKLHQYRFYKVYIEIHRPLTSNIITHSIANYILYVECCIIRDWQPLMCMLEANICLSISRDIIDTTSDAI